MRKFVCTADIHINIKKGIPEEWQVNRYTLLWDTLLTACKENDSPLFILGDLFDKASPTLHELLIASSLLKLFEDNSVAINIVAGNHCTIAKGSNTFDYLNQLIPSNVILAGKVKPYEIEKNNIGYFVDHCDLTDDYIRPDCAVKSYHILFTHFRTTVGDYIKEEIDTAKLCSMFDLVIAGDIHSDIFVGNLVYTNQPINTKFESSPNTGYLLLNVSEFSAPTVERVKTNLPNLVQINCNSDEFGSVLETLGTSDFYRIAVTGTLKELRAIKTDKTNVIVQKIPIVTDMVLDCPPQEEFDILPLDAQLIEYLKLKSYSDEAIDALVNIWKER